MKQLLTYISPDKGFNKEHQRMAKIQIENSLSLGWEPEDILLVTNFAYAHEGVKALVIGDENYCKYHWPATKIYVINYLFRKGLIKDDLYWYHDFDCFELNKIVESEVRAELGKCNFGISNYGQRIRLCSASMFFDNKAQDIFEWLKGESDKYRVGEENALMRLYYNKDNPLSRQVRMVNTTYAFHRFNIVKTYKTTIKPIRAAHFHLTPDKLDFYVYGHNKLNMVLIPKRLIDIFSKYGFE